MTTPILLKVPLLPAPPRILFGPLYPLFGHHTLSESGGSAFLPTPILLISRLLSTSALILTLVLHVATGYIRLSTLGAWAYILSTVAFGLATFSSLIYLLYPQRASSLQTKSSSPFLAYITVPFVQTSLSLELILCLVYWAWLSEGDQQNSFVQLLLYAVAPALLSIDTILAFRMWFRVFYVAFAPTFAGIWLVFAWIRSAVASKWPYQAIDINQGGVGACVAVHTSLLFGGLVIGLAVLMLNRLNRVGRVARRIRARIADEEVASMVTIDEVGEEKDLERFEIVHSDPGDNQSITEPLPVFKPDVEEEVK